MAGLKRLVGVTLAVILVTALVVFVLRPSANTTTSTVTKPGTPTDQPPPGLCSDLSRGIHRGACGTSNGNSQGSDQSGTGDHSDDHDGNDQNGHEGSDGDHDGWNHGDHSDRDDGGVDEDD